MSALFAPELKRLDILKCQNASNATQIKISVHRNHSFEMVAAVLNPFLNISGLDADFYYSDYDDSLTFGQVDNSDVHIIWLDVLRYKSIDLSSFLNERITALRQKTMAPILIGLLGCQEEIDFTDHLSVFPIYIEPELQHLKDQIFDVAKEAYSGTRLSGKASLYCARLLGLRYIPAIMLPALKAIIIDLDNTFYQGILGEDGIENIVPNLKLQKHLKSLREKGFFLCIASKNEEADARKMFNERDDFLLKWDDFDAHRVNWLPKRQNIIEIAKDLNIGTDAILFIDDNPAEIQNVAGLGLKIILAVDPQQTVNELQFFPGLLKLRATTEDTIRSKDLQANKERQKIAAELTTEEYFKKLGIHLTYAINPKKQIGRIAELFGKTNQFILTYARMNEAEVESFIASNDKCIITIGMSDNLSDSGVIAILAAHREGKTLYLDELTVSCRALGRKLENVMLPYLFHLAANQLETDAKIYIRFKKGERNGPAFKWLSELIGQSIDNELGSVEYTIHKNIDMSGLVVEVQ